MEIIGEGESRTGTGGAIIGLLGVVLCEMTLPCASLRAISSQRANIFLCRNRKSSPSTLQYGCLEKCRNFFSVKRPADCLGLNSPRS